MLTAGDIGATIYIVYSLTLASYSCRFNFNSITIKLVLCWRQILFYATIQITMTKKSQRHFDEGSRIHFWVSLQKCVITAAPYHIVAVCQKKNTRTLNCIRSHLAVTQASMLFWPLWPSNVCAAEDSSDQLSGREQWQLSYVANFSLQTDGCISKTGQVKALLKSTSFLRAAAVCSCWKWKEKGCNVKHCKSVCTQRRDPNFLTCLHWES